MSQNVDWVVLDLALENRLANANGGAFQKLFSDIMERIYGDDFIRVRPHGNLGDDGVDGYFLHEGIVYQCYGAEDGKVQRHTEVGQKMRDDFHTALTSRTRIRADGVTFNPTAALVKLRSRATARNAASSLIWSRAIVELISVTHQFYPV